ncbi:FAD-linked oxidase [Mycobacterium sp. ST-F2]|uniref:FAD-binding oxidoreductase n=1 Tax=Mycobacterium sp. ST-F2 TaxID=1490484 RepID=UPI00093DD859|nr:FAD-binding oxidoreductase [Mycobacterium sp. ST-F2]OKH83606.1 FAD-linked oxidase [Mycobacterium sp. ST-F2]
MTAVTTDATAAHEAAVQRLLASYRAIPQGATVRLAKPTSNLFRARTRTKTKGLDVSGLDGVLAVDTETRTADVQGMCTYETLVAATLPFGLAPLVVPQLKTITLGGAVTGLGIESTSFRNGLPHESVLEMDILTGAGELVTARRDRHTALFYAFPNSYGTLGYSVRLRIELEPVRPFVKLRHVRFHRVADLVDALQRILDTGGYFDGYAGVPVDYLDGVVFGPDESYLCLGMKTGTGGPVSDYTGQDIFYRSIQHDAGERHDRLTIQDYLWRWDTDWFWCSEAFGAQRPLVRRLWPRRYRRSSVYWKLVGLDQRFHIADRIERRSVLAPDRPLRERVVQDVEVPVERVAEFLEWFLAQVPITPIWLCPLRLRGDDRWPLYPIEPHRSYVNLGFWSSVPAGRVAGETNRRIEDKVGEMDGHKSLYSESFYSPEDFARRYGGDEYQKVKDVYDPESRLLGLYAKAVQRQ